LCAFHLRRSHELIVIKEHARVKASGESVAPRPCFRPGKVGKSRGIPARDDLRLILLAYLVRGHWGSLRRRLGRDVRIRYCTVGTVPSSRSAEGSSGKLLR